MGRLSQDAVEVLGILDQVHAETLARLPATARRVDSNVAEGAVDEGGKHLGSSGCHVLRVERSGSCSFSLERRIKYTWLLRTMVKLAASVETIDQTTTLGPLVVQPVVASGLVTE